MWFWLSSGERITHCCASALLELPKTRLRYSASVTEKQKALPADLSGGKRLCYAVSNKTN
jgi:hypothetical protein